MFDLTTYVKKWQIRQLKTVFSTLDTLCTPDQRFVLEYCSTGCPKKVVDIILRASGSKNWSPDIALKILLATVENRIFHLYCFFRVALHFLKTAVNIMMRAE